MPATEAGHQSARLYTDQDGYFHFNGTPIYLVESGSGGSVTQTTNRSTGVTLSKYSGQITTDTTSLAAGAEATFAVTNTLVAATDVVVVSCAGGQTSGTSIPAVTGIGSGSFSITLTNLHASTADTGAMVINFAVFKSSAS